MEISRVEKRVQKYTAKNWEQYLDEAAVRADRKTLDTVRPSGYDAYKKEFLEYMKSYADKHSTALKQYYDDYKEAISSEFFRAHYVLLNEKRIKQVISRCKVMVLTANPIEKAIFHFMIVNQTHEKIRRIICGNTVFFILKWGRYWVAHVHQPETGSYKDMGSNTTIIDALQYFTPNVIVSLGIAFGIDYQTQNIGDVLVSRRVLPYSENKRDEDKVKPDRSQDKTIDNWLHVRLVNANGFIDSITYGDILSGDSVLSSFQEKDKICLGYTKTDFIIGGEMEGSAIFQFADSDGIPGVVIKGICDWGVAKNDIFPDDTEKEEKFKESLQAMAMVCAVEKSTRLFKDPELFTEPKNANIKHLRKEQLVYRWCLSLTTIILFLLGVFELIWNHGFYRFDQSLYNAISSPFLLVCMAAALLGVLLYYSYLWKKIKTASYSTDRELKNAVSHIDLEKDSYAETRDGKKGGFL